MIASELINRKPVWNGELDGEVGGESQVEGPVAGSFGPAYIEKFSSLQTASEILSTLMRGITSAIPYRPDLERHEDINPSLVCTVLYILVP